MISRLAGLSPDYGTLLYVNCSDWWYWSRLEVLLWQRTQLLNFMHWKASLAHTCEPFHPREKGHLVSDINNPKKIIPWRIGSRRVEQDGRFVRGQDGRSCVYIRVLSRSWNWTDSIPRENWSKTQEEAEQRKKWSSNIPMSKGYHCETKRPNEFRYVTISS